MVIRLRTPHVKYWRLTSNFDVIDASHQWNFTSLLIEGCFFVSYQIVNSLAGHDSIQDHIDHHWHHANTQASLWCIEFQSIMPFSIINGAIFCMTFEIVTNHWQNGKFPRLQIRLRPVFLCPDNRENSFVLYHGSNYCLPAFFYFSVKIQL